MCLEDLECLLGTSVCWSSRHVHAGDEPLVDPKVNGANIYRLGIPPKAAKKKLYQQIKDGWESNSAAVSAVGVQLAQNMDKPVNYSDLQCDTVY